VPFYHCFGMVLGNLACTSHGACIVVPGEAFDADTVLRIHRAGTLHVALRRAKQWFIAELEHAGFEQHDLSRLRTGSWPGHRAPSR